MSLFVLFKVDSSYPCWYDTRDPNVAQWDKPSTQRAIILLSFGGVSVLLTLVFLYLMCPFIRRNTTRQSEQNNIAHIHVSFLK